MQTLEEFNKAVSITKAKLLINKENVFFASLVCSLVTKADDTVGYGATNGKTIFINPTTLMELNQQERQFLLLHETLHIAYKHVLRLGTRNQQRFNMACDYVINLQLVDCGFTMIDGGLIDYSYRDMSAEQIYDLLDQDQDDNPMSNPMSGDIDFNTTMTSSDKANIDQMLIQANMVAKQANQQGNIPVDMRRYIDSLTKPKINWQVVLRRFFTKLDKDGYSWNKPRKKYLPHELYLPARRSNSKLAELSFAIDTSGSISKKDFTQFISEVHHIMKFSKPRLIRLYQFDCCITNKTVIKSITDMALVELKGGGGTDVTEVIQDFTHNPNLALIILTDGYLNTNLPKPKQPVIWVVFDNPDFSPAFGQVIHYDYKT